MPEDSKKIILGLGATGLAIAGIYALTRKVEAVPPPPPPPPPPALANLYGKITDAVTGKAVPDVLVILNGESAYTNSSGNYIFAELEPGTYTLTFQKEDYEVQSGTMPLIEGNNKLDINLTPTLPPLAPEAKIVSVAWGAKAEQGGVITAKMTVRSNFAGTAWPIMAFGKGSPGPDASFSPHNDCGGNYAGWFPDGFNLCPNTVEYYTGPYVGSVELKVGDNIIKKDFIIPRFWPLGSYTTYCAIMPPARPETGPEYDWYRWPAPYDWKMGSPFTVVAPPLPVTAEIAIIQHINVVSWSATVYPMSEIHGMSGESSNYIDGMPGSRRIPIGEYMKFRKPCHDWTCDAYEPSIPDLSARIRSYWESAYGYAIPTEVRIRFGTIWLTVYVESHGPQDRYGIMQEYPFTATGRLTYPDGHTQEATLSGTTPYWADHLYQVNTYNYHLPLGTAGVEHGCGFAPEFYTGIPVALGKYKLRVVVVCEGKQILDKTVNFTIEAI